MSNLQEKKLKTRISHKHNFEVAWNEAHEHGFVPLAAEWIIYDREIDKQGNLLTELPEGRTEPYAYDRFKIGNGVDAVGDLDFMDEMLHIASANVFHQGTSLASLVESYLLNIDYDALAFDTTEIVVGTNTSSVLGQAILGQLVLA